MVGILFKLIEVQIHNPRKINITNNNKSRYLKLTAQKLVTYHTINLHLIHASFWSILYGFIENIDELR